MIKDVMAEVGRAEAQWGWLSVAPHARPLQQLERASRGAPTTRQAGQARRRFFGWWAGRHCSRGLRGDKIGDQGADENGQTGRSDQSNGSRKSAAARTRLAGGGGRGGRRPAPSGWWRTSSPPEAQQLHAPPLPARPHPSRDRSRAAPRAPTLHRRAATSPRCRDAPQAPRAPIMCDAGGEVCSEQAEERNAIPPIFHNAPYSMIPHLLGVAPSQSLEARSVWGWERGEGDA